MDPWRQPGPWVSPWPQGVVQTTPINMAPRVSTATAVSMVSGCSHGHPQVLGVIRGHRPYSDLIKIPSWTQGAAPPTESTWPETTAQTMDIVTAPSYGRSRPGCQQHQDQDITLRAGLASQISVASSGSWALLHQQGFRWQHRPSTSA